MHNEKTLATKLHDNLCPRCNGRCHNICQFTHTPKEEDWETNPANNYFLELAQGGIHIMEETGITEEQLVMYAAALTPEDIPDNVRLAMEKYNFH